MRFSEIASSSCLQNTPGEHPNQGQGKAGKSMTGRIWFVRESKGERPALQASVLICFVRRLHQTDGNFRQAVLPAAFQLTSVTVYDIYAFV